ncbi:pro-opiomelanocortin [Cynoglossus semilaevis]|uniref:POMC-b n=1 Tax=Cynoglossus semilaevis TaxID=244447 RepID=A0A1L6KTI8_CYNSE|nr:pro-opiomelanocortin-like [Cynoglossus semilaevis]XP_016896651.1 pro-opiomelanocortin-like [Cynoglossus semilaevis]APR72394.1 POMC-b [Cynoglossus semilaevis]
MSPVWLLVAVTLLGVATGNPTHQCWSHPSCEEINNESSMMDCVRLCRSVLAAEETDVLEDNHVQTPSPVSSLPLSPLSSSSFSSSPQTKRSYSMEHFRWGKPVGKKRYSVKGENSVEKETAEVSPEELQRRGLDQKVASLSGSVQQKKAGTYKMTHFRWSAPPNEGYGGLTAPADGRS